MRRYSTPGANCREHVPASEACPTKACNVVSAGVFAGKSASRLPGVAAKTFGRGTAWVYKLVCRWILAAMKHLYCRPTESCACILYCTLASKHADVDPTMMVIYLVIGLLHLIGPRP